MPTQMTPLMRSELEDATRRLAGTFRLFSRETVARVVHDSYERIGDRPTVGPNFMPSASRASASRRWRNQRAWWQRRCRRCCRRGGHARLRDACPVYPGKRYEDWPVPDPAGHSIEVVRRIRYDLHHHVTELLEELAIPVNAHRPPS